LESGIAPKTIPINAFGNCELQYHEYRNGYYLGNSEDPLIMLAKIKDTSIIHFEISEHTDIIGPKAFSDCKNLLSIVIPETVNIICNEAFGGCTSLSRVVLHNGITVIPNACFYECSSLTKIELPSKDRIGIIIPKDHPLAGRKCIRAEDLRNLPLIMAMRSYMNKADYADQFGIPESELNIAATGNLIYNLAILAEHRIGAILSLEGLVHTGDDSELVFIPFEPKIERTLVLTWKQNRPLNRAAEVFLNTMREKIDEKL
jgi:hypothetical protein